MVLFDSKKWLQFNKSDHFVPDTKYEIIEAAKNLSTVFSQKFHTTKGEYDSLIIFHLFRYY